MHEVFRYRIVEMKATLKNLRVIPFDTFRVIPKKYQDHIAKLSRICLIVDPPQALCDDLNQMPIRKVERLAMRRENRVKKIINEPIPLEEIFGKITTDDLLFVPIRPTANAGSAKTRMAYVGNRKWIKANSAKAAGLRSAVEAQAKNKGAHQKERSTPVSAFYADVKLQVEGEEMLPCVVCPQFYKKLRNPNHCSLGTVDCLKNVTLPQVTSFRKKEKQALLREECRDKNLGDQEANSCLLSQ